MALPRDPGDARTAPGPGRGRRARRRRVAEHGVQRLQPAGAPVARAARARVARRGRSRLRRPGPGRPDPARGRAGAIARDLGGDRGRPRAIRRPSSSSPACRTRRTRSSSRLVLVPEMPYATSRGPRGTQRRGRRADRLLRARSTIRSSPARHRQLPTVIVDSPAPSEIPALADATTRFDFVGIDDVAGAEAAMRHLLDLGHRRIGILSFGLSTYARTGPRRA